MRNTAPKDAAELEALETREWLESLDYVLQSGGPARVSKLLRELADHARRHGVKQPFTANTPYINTIPPAEQPPFPGSREIERRIKSLVRWNALAMVVHANKIAAELGGHIATYASIADMFEVGCVSTILQMLKLPDGTVKVLVEGQQRARVSKIVDGNQHFTAVNRQGGRYLNRWRGSYTCR